MVILGCMLCVCAHVYCVCVRARVLCVCVCVCAYCVCLSGIHTGFFAAGNFVESQKNSLST